MSSRPRRSAAEKAKSNADPAADHRNVIEMIKGITGASAEDVELVLKDCGGNADEATARLIEDPSLIFSQVQSKKEKKKKRDEERKVQPQVSDSLETQPRGGHSSRGRGRGRGRDDRGGRGYGRSNDRSSDRGLRSHPAYSEQPSSVDVRFDSHTEPTTEKAGAGWGPSTSERDADPSTQQGGSSWGPSASSKPSGGKPSGGWENVAEEGTGTGSWDAVVEEPKNTRQHTWGAQDAESVAPPANSTQQPIGTQPGPAPIKPSNTGTQVRSMADLFKQKPAPSVAPVQQPPAPAQPQQPAHKPAPSAAAPPLAAAPGASLQSPSTPKSALDTQPADEHQNGWGPNTSDQKIEMQSDSLAGSYGGGHKSVQPPPGIIASSAAPSSLPPVERSQNATSISNQGWQQAEESRPSTDTWGAAHSNAGLGGLGLDSGLHHSYLGDPQSSWLNSSQASQPQSLGNAMLSSLNQPVTSQSNEHHSVVPSHNQDLVSSSSGYHTSGVGQAISQRLPSNQASQMQFGDFSQFSNLDLGDSKSEGLKPPPAAHYATAFSQASKLPNLQGNTASDIKTTPFMQPSVSSSSNPQSYSTQSLDHQGLSQQALSQQQAGHSNSQQTQHQRAVNAFNAASQPQSASSHKLTAPSSTAPDSAATNNQALYANQGYQTGTSYAQYQYPQQQNNAYYNSYQQEPESTLPQGVETASSAAPHSKLAAASTASSVSYDPSGYSSYNQPTSQRENLQAQPPRELSQAAAEFQPPAHSKYGNSSSGSLAAGGHGSLAPGGHNNHSAATVLSQQQGLSQMGQGYGSQLPQNFYNQTQQYAFPQYNTYTQASTGYGAGYGGGYQQQGQFAPGGYSQAGKYGGAYGGAGAYQHAGYGLDKKDQQLGHGLYGQQQPLAGRQHFGGAGAQDAYGYQAQNQAYRGYGGQYGQFYGQNQ